MTTTQTTIPDSAKLLPNGTATVNLTSACNHRCGFCFEECDLKKAHDTLTPEECRSVLNELKGQGVKLVCFSGGEATLSPHFFEALRYARQLDFEVIELITNGSNHSPEVIRVLKDTNTTVGVSLHCDLPAIHDQITRRKGSHKDAVAFIRKALQAGIALRAGVISCGTNDHRLVETYHFLTGLGVESVLADRVRDAGSGRSLTESGYPTYPALSPSCENCLERHICIDADGTATPCAIQREHPMGNIRETPLREILKSPARMKVVQMLKQAAALLPKLAPLLPEESYALAGSNICPSSFGSCCSNPHTSTSCS